MIPEGDWKYIQFDQYDLNKANSHCNLNCMCNILNWSLIIIIQWIYIFKTLTKLA